MAVFGPVDFSAAVDSIFGRIGVVTATSGDYTAAQVTNAADKASSSDQTFAGGLMSTGDHTKDVGAASARWNRVFCYEGFFGASNGLPGYLNVTNALGDTTTVPMVVRAITSQSGDLQQWQAQGGSPVAKIGVAGLITGAGAALNPISSGALSTISPASTTALQVSTTRDVFLMQTCTFNPSAGATATCKVELSPDNSTYSIIITVTVPVGVVFDGGIPPIAFQVPAGWWVKFTTTNATLGTGTYY